ncbi:OstA-like protein [Flavobacteriaceae bacterium TP-CH-4]|uniref:OstA-like protein n=1 Tax=Pelagihabitans pacificus TaxID=2696054 RepID=A0A967AVK3_9FLAO|nr:OstA-like protein [Pelagihabitans pacificus]NHF61184.1 OstA-like protein [Pelagihabitans pacificus]
MNRLYYLFVFFFISGWTVAQEEQESDTTQINIVYGANFTKDEEQFPGAFIFSKDERQVQFEHQGADLWCDIAIHYQKENRLRALGNVRLQQGDSVELVSGTIDYDGETKLAKAYEEVVLTNKTMTITTDTLYFDREKQESYYQDSGTVVDSVNTLTSEIGRYFLEIKKAQFLDSVHIDNPDFTLDSEQLDYYTNSKNAYMYGPSTIIGETYKMYCERGFYDTNVESGYGIKNTRIDYNNRIIEGDSVYFEKASEFASATNNIKVTDTINKGVIKAHYAEVYKAKDSVFATKRAVSISLVEQDSLYMHGDTLMVTGKPEYRILRAFRNAKFYKTDLSGKCDSIHSEQRTGVTKLIKNPVIWNGENQMTGDSIHLISDLKTEKLDSLKVLNNAFVISQDTIGKVGYNQAKGKDLFGKFIDNELKYIDLIKNTEVIYYMYDELDLIGINKTICSKINITLANNDIEDLTFITEPDGDIFPEKDLPENSRKLKGFVWRGDERILTKDDIFDEDDNNIELVVIRGVNNPIDIDLEEEDRSLNESDPVNNIQPGNSGETDKKSKFPGKKPKISKTSQPLKPKATPKMERVE